MPLPYLLSYGRQPLSTLAILAAISLLTLRAAGGSPGAVDTAFDAGDIDGDIQEIVARPDGRLLLRGTFTRIQGMPRPGLARLQADGTLDAGFDPGTGVDGALSSFAVQADGRILLAGTFTAFNGIARTNFARLNADGQLDTEFATPADVPFVAGMARRVFALATGQSLDLGWQSRSSFSLFRHTANGDFDLVFERTELSGSTQPILAVQAEDGRCSD